MIGREGALQLIQDSLSSLHRVGLIEQEVNVGDDTVLLGTGSALDSVAFVTFVADLEERLARETGLELYVVLDDIHEFNANAPSLSADALARYIVDRTGERVSSDG